MALQGRSIFRMKAVLDNDRKRQTHGGGKSILSGVPTLINSGDSYSNVNLGEVWICLEISRQVGERGRALSSLML